MNVNFFIHLDFTDAPSWDCVCTLSGYHNRTIFDLDWSLSHNAIATASADDGVRIFMEKKAGVADPLREPQFDLTVSQPKAHTQDINCVSWNPIRANLLASCSDDGTIKIWDFNHEQ